MIFTVTNIVDTFFPVEGVDLNAGQSIDVIADDYASLPDYLRLFKMQGIVTIEAQAEAGQPVQASVDSEIDS